MTKVPVTQLTLKYLRGKGYTCGVTEHFNFYTQRKNDLFGFIDIVALADDEIIGVQCTSKHNMLDRKKKIAELVDSQTWKKAGGKILLIGWKKEGYRYQCKEEWL